MSSFFRRFYDKSGSQTSIQTQNLGKKIREPMTQDGFSKRLS
ncbi:MAG: hypothetical protein U5L45_26645 [Saprospiraceae bacterium]|nr:hypothetical protein [Saprospiraceae bacterium]